MRPFHTIAIPDTDILEGRLTMNVFAADIWETHIDKIVPGYSPRTNLMLHEKEVVRYIVTQEEIMKKGNN
jgi:hypothetical protein